MSEPLPTYCTLCFMQTDACHRAGERIAASSSVVRIGQQEDCDVRFENRSDYADELFAIVRLCRTGDGWQLIPCSEFEPVTVNGAKIGLVHYLTDGDRIAFGDEGRELLFNVHRDGNVDTASGTIHIAPSPSGKWMAALVLISILLTALLGGAVYRTTHAEKRMLAALDRVKPSVLRICVDSVYFVEMTSSGATVLRTWSTAENNGHAVSGTAFLTQDSLLITARHCIEPWLNDPEIMTIGDPAALQSIPARWALEAETYNQLHASDTVYRVVSDCFLEPSGERFLSSAFRFDTSRDHIMDMGDYHRDFYWRSLRGRRGNRQMMLGDIASLKIGRAGNIVAAEEKELEEWLYNGSKLSFLGYPDYETGDIEHSAGEVKQSFAAGEMITHDGSGLRHGYSGGPVFVVRDGNLYAVGVISVLDGTGGNRAYSVPISECVHKKGGLQ